MVQKMKLREISRKVFIVRIIIGIILLLIMIGVGIYFFFWGLTQHHFHGVYKGVRVGVKRNGTQVTGIGISGGCDACFYEPLCHAAKKSSVHGSNTSKKRACSCGTKKGGRNGCPQYDGE